jgi:hypothetical protein
MITEWLIRESYSRRETVLDRERAGAIAPNVYVWILLGRQRNTELKSIECGNRRADVCHFGANTSAKRPPNPNPTDSDENQDHDVFNRRDSPLVLEKSGAGVKFVV